jgi:hypothetical protein
MRRDDTWIEIETRRRPAELGSGHAAARVIRSGVSKGDVMELGAPPTPTRRWTSRQAGWAVGGR